MGKRPHLSILDLDEHALDALRDAAATAGVEIATIAGYTNFTLGRDTEIPAVEIQVAYVRQLARLARRLGARIVRIFTGYLVDPDAFQRDWEICVRAVRECAAVAADQGVILGVQNHHDVGVGVASYCEFLDEVDHPNCRAMFDPWAPALHGEDLQALGPPPGPPDGADDPGRLRPAASLPVRARPRELRAARRRRSRRAARRRIPRPRWFLRRAPRRGLRRLRGLRDVLAAPRGRGRGRISTGRPEPAWRGSGG